MFAFAVSEEKIRGVGTVESNGGNRRVKLMVNYTMQKENRSEIIKIAKAGVCFRPKRLAPSVRWFVSHCHGRR